MLIIFFSVAEDEVCGSKIGDENPKNCCPPGAIELLIAKWLIYSKILARLAFDTIFFNAHPLISFLFFQIERELLQVSALRHLMFAASIPTGVQSEHQLLKIKIKLLMLFIPALLNTRKTSLKNLVVHQMAASSKTKVQQRKIVPQDQIVSSSSGPNAVKRFHLLCHLVTTTALIVSSLEWDAARIGVL